ncbi:hypothetical protein [Prosthecomicrobium hirschii]|uniref:hypothetical protein n=1 Tax=Prosthecodimorpha hirschii TaxID=665126 RepID=UPI001364CEDE|nr:hypothetical protein [Prosthecomicrobium hirschii]
MLEQEFQPAAFFGQGQHVGFEPVALGGGLVAQAHHAVEIGDQDLGLPSQFGQKRTDQDGAADRGERIFRSDQERGRRLAADPLQGGEHVGQHGTPIGERAANARRVAVQRSDPGFRGGHGILQAAHPRGGLDQLRRDPGAVAFQTLDLQPDLRFPLFRGADVAGERIQFRLGLALPFDHGRRRIDGGACAGTRRRRGTRRGRTRRDRRTGRRHARRRRQGRRRGICGRRSGAAGLRPGASLLSGAGLLPGAYRLHHACRLSDAGRLSGLSGARRAAHRSGRLGIGFTRGERGQQTDEKEARRRIGPSAKAPCRRHSRFAPLPHRCLHLRWRAPNRAAPRGSNLTPAAGKYQSVSIAYPAAFDPKRPSIFAACDRWSDRGLDADIRRIIPHCGAIGTVRRRPMRCGRGRVPTV